MTLPAKTAVPAAPEGPSIAHPQGQQGLHSRTGVRAQRKERLQPHAQRTLISVSSAETAGHPCATQNGPRRAPHTLDRRGPSGFRSQWDLGQPRCGSRKWEGTLPLCRAERLTRHRQVRRALASGLVGSDNFCSEKHFVKRIKDKLQTEKMFTNHTPNEELTWRLNNSQNSAVGKQPTQLKNGQKSQLVRRSGWSASLQTQGSLV